MEKKCPIRVLHIVINMNRGGTETLIMNLYRNIDHTKIQFDFLTCNEGVFDTEIASLGGVVHRIPYVTDVGHFGYLKALTNFFDSHKVYSIVHSHLDRMSGLVLLAAKRAGIPVRIAHCHSTQSEGGSAARLYKWYASKFIHSGATDLMACSAEASKWLFGKDAGQCLIVKNGIEISKFALCHSIRRQIREELTINDNVLVVGHVGRFDQPKNHTFLIDIFGEFAKSQRKAVLVLVGDGPLYPNIQSQVKSLDLQDKVKFLGVRGDVNLLLQAFDVFLFPSLYEGLGVALIEAQAAGIPCLASNTITKEVDLGIGLVDYLPLNNKMIWVKKLKEAAIRSSSKATSEVLRKKGYDITAIAEWLQDFYLTV